MTRRTGIGMICRGLLYALPEVVGGKRTADWNMGVSGVRWATSVEDIRTDRAGRRDRRQGTVSELGGTLIHEHSWSNKWQKNESHHGHNCAAANCPITDTGKKYGYAVHSGGTGPTKTRLSAMSAARNTATLRRTS